MAEDVTDPMSVSMAKTQFSESVEREVRHWTAISTERGLRGLAVKVMTGDHLPATFVGLRPVRVGLSHVTKLSS